jgi:hypothetical protein
MMPADRHDADLRRAVEHEAIAGPAAAAAREERARLRAVEAEMRLGLFRQCPGCGDQVPLAEWARHCVTSPDLCDLELKGKAA